ncbi:ABC transporter permease [Alloacidobacterium dinghuense]|uniref:ABC transporter permease n=1 Tax=Alloacidobacterium dinghuense TaxID=2763107 RepID=A0A7G8BMY9_9BACT|nr:ABC transporter permease [Alloacidobacterium dinghuense]QNI33909.1 ABC transporter permease [Alloacidobacterium dinghuense]
MDWMLRIFRKLTIVGRGERFKRELEEEMVFHREETAKQFRARGMASEDARYAASRQFGNDVRLRDESHETVAFWFEGMVQDFRFALRQLRKNPGFALTAIVILTFGIGASVAIFGFVDAALIKPLPYKDPNRLVVLFESIPLGPRFHLSYPDYVDWKRQNTVFQSLDVYAPYGFMLTDSDGTHQADGARVSDGFFHTLGVAPVLGRDFRSGEDQKNASRTVLLSYSAWQRRYGGRKDVLGQTVVLDGKPNTIIGVLPRDFHFAPAEPADFWTTSQGEISGCRGCHGLYGIARLKVGVSFQTAFANIKGIADQLARQYPDSNRDQKAYMLPMTEVIVGDIRPILLVLLSGAGLLLLIATINVASLLMVRSESRRREIAVRGALGASRMRLIRQFVTEGLVLVTTSSLLGIAAAYAGMQVIGHSIPKDMMATMPYLRGLGFNPRVLLFACAISLIAGVLFSFTPALRLSGADMREGLTDGGRGYAGTMWRRIGSNLVVVELTTAMVLLVGAGLLGQSFYHLLHVDIGLQPDHLAFLTVGAASNSYDKDEPKIALERRLIGEVSSLSGVKSAGISTSLPIGDGDGTTGFRIVGRPYHGEHMEVAIRKVSSGYFTTLQAQLLRGRYLAEDEDNSKPQVVVISETMAKQYFPGENPIGKQIAFDIDKPKEYLEIIGEVKDLQEGQLDAAPRGAMYVPYNQGPTGFFSLIVRTSQDEESLLPALTSLIHQIDPNIATFGASTMRERIHNSPVAYLHRSAAWLVGGFAGLALLLGVVGLYGVIAYSVSQRTREIGVRMALGAQRGSVYRLILREAGWLTVVGIAAGMAASLGVTMLMRKLLFGVRAWDVSTLIAVAIVLGGCALVASYLPAKRAASVNPVEALRAE